MLIKMNKKAIEWSQMVILLIAIASLAVIILFYSGIFPSATDQFTNTTFGVLG